jgi:hypothetical protein
MEDKYLTDEVIAIIQEIARVLWSMAALLAPWLVPLAPAVFFGWTIYQTAINAEMPGNYATLAAVAAAVGLETVNIAANHAMLRLSHDYREHFGKFALSLSFILVYVTIGVVAMWLLDVSDGVRIIGVGMFLLAPVAIGAQALTMDLVRVKEETRKRDQEEEKDKAWEREQAERRMKLDHERKLELDRLRWQHKTNVALSDTDRHLSVTSMTPVCQWPDKQAFLSDTNRPSDMSPRQLASMADISERTAYRWLKDAENGKDS